MKNIFYYLKKNFSANPNEIDRLIISAFLRENNITVNHNEFLKSYIILESNVDEFENLLKFISVLD